jgi:GST-like protein
MIELFGDRTGNCLRVAVTLEEAGLDYRVRKVSLASGEHRQPNFMSLNPTGKVPTMVETRSGEPLVLSQSVAIMLWAAQRAPDTVMPRADTDAHTRAVERLMMVTTDMVALSQAAFMLRMAGEESGSTHLSNTVLGRLDWLEGALDDCEYLAGDTFSLADIAAATLVSPLRGRAGWDRYPRLGEWYGRIAGRPAFLRGVRAFD